MKNTDNSIKSNSFYIKSKKGNLLLKSIKGFDNYLVSRTGRIYTRNNLGKLTQKTLFLEPNSEYLKVYLSKNGHKRGYFVHNVVGNAFKNRSKSDKLFEHKDKNLLNNESNNLKVKKNFSTRVSKESLYKYKAENLLSEIAAGISPEKANILLTEYKKFRVGRTHRACYNYLLIYKNGSLCQ